MKRRHFYARFLPFLLTACAIDTPVAESSARFDDRLGDDLEPWCESWCDKLAGCGLNDEDCSENCFYGYTTSFIGKGEICEESALSLMDCYDEASCAEITNDACSSRLARDRCSASQGGISCTPSGSGNSGGTGGAGGSSGASSCEVHYDDCEDGRTYQVSCTGADPRECHCLIDDASSGRFRWDRGGCPEAFQARQICAWPIIPSSDEPQTRPVPCAARIVIPAAGGGSTSTCEFHYDDCFNGAAYGIVCDAGTGMCTCLEDGEPVGAFISADAVCPYILDPDGGTAALNAACGFLISWSTAIE